jgi:putative oxidoreductase
VRFASRAKASDRSRDRQRLWFTGAPASLGVTLRKGGTMAAQHSVRISIALLILRLGAGGLLLAGHGWSKLMHWNERAASFADPLHVGPVASFALVIFAEVLCSALVMVGLFTRLAVIPILIFFSVAVLIQHAHDPWSKKELALVYAGPFLALAITGPGRYSLDARIGRRTS